MGREGAGGHIAVVLLLKEIKGVRSFEPPRSLRSIGGIARRLRPRSDARGPLLCGGVVGATAAPGFPPELSCTGGSAAGCRGERGAILPPSLPRLFSPH